MAHSVSEIIDNKGYFIMSNGAFLILFIAFIALMGIVPFLLRRFNIPAVISLLIVGMLIGPTGLGIDLVSELSQCLAFLNPPGSEAEMAAAAKATANHFMTFVNSLGSLGLMLLMALAGMEADFELIRSTRKPVILLSILTFLVPAATGYWIFGYFRPHDLPGKLLYGSLFASHSVGIVFPVIRELKLSHTRFGASVLISTVITDIASIILLAVSLQLYRQQAGVSHMVVNNTLSIFDHMESHLLGNSFLPVFLLIVLIYMAFSLFTVNRLGKFIARIIQPSEDMMITLLMLIILGTVLIGELFGINMVVGAFIAGLGLAKVVKERSFLLFRRFESIGYGFVIPFLFVSIGMESDFGAFRAGGNLAIILLTVSGLILSKIISGFVAMRISGFKNGHGIVAGLMTVPQLSATLAAAAVGKEQGMLDSQFFNAIIILSIITTLPIPTIVRLIIKRGKLTFDNGEFNIPRVVKEEELL